MEPLQPLHVDFIEREPPYQFPERDAGLQPGQRGTETEMDAVAEGQVSLDGAVGDEALRLIERSVVAIGRSVDEEDDLPLRDLLAVAGDRMGGHSTLVMRRWVETQEFFDRIGPEVRIVNQAGALIGELRQDNLAGGDHLGRGLIAGHAEE